MKIDFFTTNFNLLNIRSHHHTHPVLFLITANFSVLHRSEVNFSRCHVSQLATSTDARVEIDTEASFRQRHRELWDVDFEIVQIVVAFLQWTGFGNVAVFQDFVVEKLDERLFVLGGRVKLFYKWKLIYVSAIFRALTSWILQMWIGSGRTNGL